MTGTWRLDRVEGAPSDVHSLEIPGNTGRSVWVVAATSPALVLGSTQAESDVRSGAAAAAGLDVVRRRSGGGAVLVEPTDLVWIDVIVPRTDPLWDDDIGRSGIWLGEVWQRALSDFGVATEMHSGPMPRDDLARTVCFVGRAAPELTVGGAKVLGVAQRRTRHWARFQCAAVLRWDPDALLDVLAPLSPDDCDRVRGCAVGLGLDAADLTDAFVGHLASV